ncbi:hypothetical protein IV203_027239 [Nitzschia inconspicua]|uniref:Uncharacterized protein n=1 Tax=Nitzschia inconspicua TaxID=303405 RepID=A0A9K3Q3D3_9STRA|nr:hypothetical protein IV203_027239 [Nitzschia inconspicua]
MLKLVITVFLWSLQLASAYHQIHGNAAARRRLSGTREEWIQNSLQYYRTITRGADKVLDDNPLYLQNAMESYFARQKIKEGKAHHAETIYRRLLQEMTLEKSHHHHHHSPADEENECCLSSIAVPTLLLGLLLQREGRTEDARTVFESFVYLLNRRRRSKRRKLTKTEGHDCFSCCCCARVFQAFALFEMKQGNPQRAVKLIQQAIRMDRTLRPVLRWKLFQDAMTTSFEKKRSSSSGSGGKIIIPSVVNF